MRRDNVAAQPPQENRFVVSRSDPGGAGPRAGRVVVVPQLPDELERVDGAAGAAAGDRSPGVEQVAVRNGLAAVRQPIGRANGIVVEITLGGSPLEADQVAVDVGRANGPCLAPPLHPPRGVSACRSCRRVSCCALVGNLRSSSCLDAFLAARLTCRHPLSSPSDPSLGVLLVPRRNFSGGTITTPLRTAIQHAKKDAKMSHK